MNDLLFHACRDLVSCQVLLDFLEENGKHCEAEYLRADLLLDRGYSYGERTLYEWPSGNGMGVVGGRFDIPAGDGAGVVLGGDYLGNGSGRLFPMIAFETGHGDE